MNPGLVSRRALKIAKPSPDRGAAPVALAILLGAIAVFGALQFSGRTPAPSPARLKTIASVRDIPGTHVPAPPATFGLLPLARSSVGRHVFEPARHGALSTRTSQQLFDFYLSTMPSEGWKLSGKADPGQRGEWTLRWDFGPQSTLITLYMTPSQQLTVDYCPPHPYC